MHVCILLPQMDSSPELEEALFAFTRKLERYCASIASCSITIESSADDQPGQATFIVHAQLEVFGQNVRLHARASARQGEDALGAALDHVFRGVARHLDSIAQEHVGCGCGRETAGCLV